MSDFKARWNGSYPNLCYGEWSLEYNGLPVIIPEDHRTGHMGTHGSYSSWHFEDWLEVFEEYEEGLNSKVWTDENKHWVKPMFTQHGIEESETTYLALFEAFQESDFRPNSCGGCI